MTNPRAPRGRAYEVRDSETYSVCPPCGSIRRNDAFTDTCSNGPHAPVPLRVEQCHLRWAQESTILAQALLGNGRADPAAVLVGVIEATVRKSNFGLSLEFVHDLEDDALAWHLFQWLRATHLIQKHTRTTAEASAHEAQRVEAVQKKSETP